MTVPEGMPELSFGAHFDPHDGGCFMEVASLLAGEAWSDSPRCTHPALATVARLVNDATSPAGRYALAPLVTLVIGRTGTDPRIAPAIVQTTLHTTLRFAPSTRALRRHLRRSERRLTALSAATGDERGTLRPNGRPRRRTWLGARLYQRGPAMHALAAAVRALGRLHDEEDRDAALRQVLVACIQITRKGRAAGPSAAGQASADHHRSSPAAPTGPGRQRRRERA